MAVDVAAGHPQYAGNFIPELWSGKLLIKFYSACVVAAISNTDYANEFKSEGDIVKIRQVPDITIRDYVKGQDLIIERPESGIVEYPLDKAHYFNFLCDDIDAHQSDIDIMNKFSDDAGKQMSIHIDTAVLAAVYAYAATYNAGTTAGYKSQDINLGTTGSALEITKANILEKIVDCGNCLDEYDAPDEARSMVVPAWFANMIKKSDLKDASLAGDGTSIMRNGRIGMIDTFTIYKSNLLTSVSDTYTCWHALALQRNALSFASSIDKTRAVESERTFGTLVSGLNCYGYKVLKGEALVDLYCYKSE